MKQSYVRCLLVGALIVAVSAGAGAAAFATFSVTVTVRDDVNDRVTSDGSGPYVDYGDPGGRAPSVVANPNLNMDLRGSLRVMCFVFDRPLSALEAYAPKDGCYPVLLRTLSTEAGGLASLPSGGYGTFSLVIYWTGPGNDGTSRNYNVEYRRVDGNGVGATASDDGNSWQIDPLTNVARVSAYLSGKSGGWNVAGYYDMPMSLRVDRQNPNLRTSGRK